MTLEQYLKMSNMDYDLYAESKAVVSSRRKSSLKPKVPSRPDKEDKMKMVDEFVDHIFMLDGEAKMKEAEAGLERGVTRVEVLFQNKWYKGVFSHSDDLKHPKEPFAIQCDADKKGLLTWAPKKNIRDEYGKPLEPIPPRPHL